jgi:hypothetical protein
VRDWGRTLIRSFGIANWFYGLTGAYFLTDGLRRVHYFGRYPYEAKAYYFLVTINALFLLALFLTGYWLILIRRRGAILSNYLFSTEILFSVLSALISLFCYVWKCYRSFCWDEPRGRGGNREYGHEPSTRHGLSPYCTYSSKSCAETSRPQMFLEPPSTFSAVGRTKG